MCTKTWACAVHHVSLSIMHNTVRRALAKLLHFDALVLEIPPVTMVAVCLVVQMDLSKVKGISKLTLLWTLER